MKQSAVFRSAAIILLWLLFAGCQPATIEATDDLDSVAFVESEIQPGQIDPEDEMLSIGQVQFGDLDSMIARRRIRALVPYTHAFYYIDGKERRGIAFEALQLFEKYLNDKLKFRPPRVRIVFIPVNRQQMIPLLRNGYADLAFAGITITPERQELVDFSIPTISGVREIIVGGPIAPKISSLAGLSGQQVYVHMGSSYARALQTLNDSLSSVGLAPLEIEAIDPYLEVEDMLSMVNSGVIPFTVMMEDAAKLWAHKMSNLTLYTEFPVSKNVSDGWAFRKQSPWLKQMADGFLAKNRKGTLIGNMLYNKYLKEEKFLNNAHSIEVRKQLKNLENAFRKYAGEYNLNWLLLAAQGYQESRLNQQAVSKAGAIGIMQIKRSTASGAPIKIANIHRPEDNVHAGAKYLRHIIDHYFHDDAIDPMNKELLALASYNAGPTRIARLRRRARDMGLNANLWFDNVEIVAAREIGTETVQYVSNIYKFYSSYQYLEDYSARSGKKVLN